MCCIPTMLVLRGDLCVYGMCMKDCLQPLYDHTLVLLFAITGTTAISVQQSLS